MNCDNCKTNEKRYREETALAMAERTIKRLWITNILLIVLLVAGAVCAFLYETSFTDVQIEQEAEADGDGIAINANGEVMYYASEGTTDD